MNRINNFDSENINNQTVSVILPLYNGETHIKETLDSVLSQSYNDLEILVIDDCSTDNSQQIIDNYIKENPNTIKYHRLEKNSGVAIARNTALDLATGRYIAFLDSDDIWLKNKLEEQISLLEKTHGGFCYTAIEMINNEGNIIKKKRIVKEQVNYKYLLKNTIIATSSVLIDKNILGSFHMPLMRSGQDYATWLMLLKTGVIAFGINKALVQYRVSRNSLSSNKLKSIKQVWQIQVDFEKISPLVATYNVCFFIVNALKKYLIS